MDIKKIAKLLQEYEETKANLNKTYSPIPATLLKSKMSSITDTLIQELKDHITRSSII